MQTLKPRGFNLTRLAGVVLVLFLVQSCGMQRTMTFPSPSRKAAIEIWQTRWVNSWRARVELVTENRRTVLYTQRHEAFIHFVHVYWSPDETKVGVFVAYGILAANVKTGATIPFDEIRKEFAQSIRDTYRLPPQEDPISWAGLADAQFAFARLHPEIRQTY